MANTNTTDRSVVVNVSLKLSALDKLEKLIESTGKGRSELLADWISEKFDAAFPQPISIEEELSRL